MEILLLGTSNLSLHVPLVQEPRDELASHHQLSCLNLWYCQTKNNNGEKLLFDKWANQIDEVTDLFFGWLPSYQ